MQQSIALLRGINVGGKNILPMAELRALFTDLGCEQVKSYIQSGNIIFQAAVSLDAAAVQQAIEAQYGFAPEVLLLSVESFLAAIHANPFPEVVEDAKNLHLYFLAEAADDVDREKLEHHAKESERYHLAERCFYLHAPEGIGRSKLVATLEPILGVKATGRNWRTISKIESMLL